MQIFKDIFYSMIIAAVIALVIVAVSSITHTDDLQKVEYKSESPYYDEINEILDGGSWTLDEGQRLDDLVSKHQRVMQEHAKRIREKSQSRFMKRLEQKFKLASIVFIVSSFLFFIYFNVLKRKKHRNN